MPHPVADDLQIRRIDEDTAAPLLSTVERREIANERLHFGVDGHAGQRRGVFDDRLRLPRGEAAQPVVVREHAGEKVVEAGQIGEEFLAQRDEQADVVARLFLGDGRQLLAELAEQHRRREVLEDLLELIEDDDAATPGGLRGQDLRFRVRQRLARIDARPGVGVRHRDVLGPEDSARATGSAWR